LPRLSQTSTIHIHMKKTLHIIAAAAFVAFLTPDRIHAQEKQSDTVETPAAALDKPKRTTSPLRGKIASVDPAAKTVTMEGEAKLTVAVTDSTKLKKGSGMATWDDLKVGEEVRGQYNKTADGKLEAVSIKVGPRSEEDKAKSEQKKAKKDAKAAE